MQKELFKVLLGGLSLGWLLPRTVHAAEKLDKYGGDTRITGHPAESFHLERIGKRRWLDTPVTVARGD